MDLLLEIISWSGILIPLLFIFIEKDKKKFYDMITGYFLLSAIIFSVKFFFGPSRNYIDPFQFPSMHMAFVSLFMFFYPNLFSVLFALLIGETRIILGVHNSIDILFGFIFAGLVYFIVMLVENKRVRRQFVHIGLAVSFGFLLYINRLFGIASLIVSLVGYVLLYDKSIVRELTNYFGRQKFDYGTVNLLVGLLIVSLLWDKAWIAAIFLGWVDGLASIFGYSKSAKSLIGFTGGLIGGFLAAFITNSPLGFAPILAFVELISPTDDNLVIPISVWITYLLFQFSLL